MARRVSLPSAEDLFRPTEDMPEGAASSTGAKPATGAMPANGSQAANGGRPAPPAAAGNTERRPSGRVRHDEKMTVYVTSEELLEIEHARLALRSRHGIAVDRGRLVREAVALVLADLEQHGHDSALVRRLREG